MAEIRSHYQEFANLPAYTGPGLPTPARNTISALTAIPEEKYIRALDENVRASKKGTVDGCRTLSDVARSTVRLHI